MRHPARCPGAWLILALAGSLGCDDGAPGGGDTTGLDARPDAQWVDAEPPAAVDMAAPAVRDGGSAGCGSDAGCADALACDRQDPGGGCFEALCSVDDECPEDTWCDGGACVPGCRLDPDNCAATPAGVLRRCGADHTCVELLPCCGDDDTCRAVPEAECDGQVLRSVATCAPDGAFAEANPCTVGGPLRCEWDGACGEAFYCDPVDQRCYPGCRADDPFSCPAHFVCGDGHACVELPCEEDADCPDFAFCQTGPESLCREGCRLDGCRDSLVCDPWTRECGVDHDGCRPELCPPGTYCPGPQPVFPMECVPIPVLPCPNGHQDCSEFEHCDPETAMCVEGCLDDAFEDQDGFADTPPLALSPPDADGARHGSAEDRILCPGTRDFYAVTLAPGERMRVTVDCGEAIDCVDARVFHENLFDHSDLFEHTAPPRGFDYPPLGVSLQRETTYTLEIIGQGRVDYRLDVRTTRQACFPDESEPNDTADTGRYLMRRNHTFVDQSLCADDEDWFCFEPGRNGAVRIELTTTPESDAVTVELFALSHAQAPGGLAEPDYGGDDVAVELTAQGAVHRFARDHDTASFSSEPWCARVRLADGSTAADYHVAFSVAESDDFACERVRNDSFETGIDLDAIPELVTDGLLTPDVDHQVTVDGVLCARDVDYHCFTAAEGDTLQAWLVGDGVAGTLTAQLFDPNQQPIGAPAEHTSPGDPVERAEAPDVTAGRHCVVVDGNGPSQGPYDLFVRRAPRAVP